MKFLLDANIPLSTLAVFKALGQDAEHVSDVGLGHSTDEEIAAYARRRRRIIVTRDLDFGTLAVHYRVPVYGVIILRLHFTATAVAIKEALHAFLQAVDTKTLAHTLVIVEPDRYRIRKL
jgi:predicted nuclease of predicted toxin-antitoxin system